VEVGSKEEAKFVHDANETLVGSFASKVKKQKPL